MIERRRSCCFSSVGGQIRWHGCANMPLDLSGAVCMLYTSTHVQPPLLPPPCWHNLQRPRPHAWFRLFSSLQAISNNLHWWYGTEAGTWRALRLPGDRPLLCSCLRRRKVPQFTTAASGCLSSGCTRPAIAPLADVLSKHVTTLLRKCDLYRKMYKKGWKWPPVMLAPPSHCFCHSRMQKKDTLLSHTDATAKDRNSLFFNSNSLISFYL